jgi:hypothetical protein
MNTLVVACACAAAAINLAAAALGGLRWWLVQTSRAFWPLLRAGQAAAVAFAALCGVGLLLGHRPDSGLFWLYAVLPIAVAFVAEQLRIASAQAVLEARGLPDAQAVGRLPADEQHSVVLAIVRRELGVMAAAAAVAAFLLLRAASTAHGF